MTAPRRGLRRRDLLKLLQVGGAIGAVGGVSLLGREAHGRRTTLGTCRLCTMHCGIVGTIEGERLVRVEGDPRSPTRGFLCGNGYALRELVHSNDRVRQPLKRIGSKLVPISWEQANAEIAERLLALKQQHGGQALAVQTGWPFVRHPIVPLLQRFCQAFGTPNLATVASLCEASGRMGRTLTVGTNFLPDVARARTLVVWGANPTCSAPPFAHEVAGFSQNRTLIVIDPIRTELAAQAHEHLQIRPGTDGLLALAWLRLIIDNGWYDPAFVEHQTTGFAALKTLAQQRSLDEVAQLTGVPADQIVRAARRVATEGPTSVWDGLGVEHHENGVQTVRAIAMVQALLGYVDTPGGGTLSDRAGAHYQGGIIPGQHRMLTAHPVPPPVAAKPIGYDQYPLYEALQRQAQGNLFADAILNDTPYPLRALMVIGANPLVTSPDSARMRAAFDKLSLLVSIDPFLTATGERAHYVLPAATFAEVEDVSSEQPEVARSGLVEVQHQARGDWKIVFDLARALGMERYFPWQSFAEAQRAPRSPYLDDPAHAIVVEEEAPALPRYPSPSGKIELESRTLARFGQSSLPAWTAPSEQPSAEYPLYLVTGPRTRVFINSQLRTIPALRRKLPAATARLHPKTAAALKVVEGARVAVVTCRGQLELPAALDDSLREDMVVIPSGWANASANLLTDGTRRDPVSGFPAFRSLACRIVPI